MNIIDTYTEAKDLLSTHDNFEGRHLLEQFVKFCEDDWPSVDFFELLECQRALQAAMGNPTGIGEVGVKENLLHVIVETTEALTEINFKPWKTQKKLVNRQALATELTDILQFWANAANAMGFTAEELTTALRAKWRVNYERINEGSVVKLSEVTFQHVMLGEEDCEHF